MIETSAVVPAYNNENTIRQCLESIESNDLDETIVVDGGSVDKTVDIVTGFENVRLIRIGRGIARARNIGWRAAKGNLILFLDADAYIKRNTLPVLRSYLVEPEIAGVSCRVACANPERFWARMRDFDFSLLYADQFERSSTVDCIADSTDCGLFRRKSLEEVDGFDLTYPFAEDLKVLERLKAKGFRFLMVQDPAVYHHHRENYHQLYRQFYNHGLGRGILAKELNRRFYPNKNPSKFISLFLRNAAKAGVEVSFCYPYYRVFTETAFFMGYMQGKRLLREREAGARARLQVEMSAAMD